MVRVFLLWGFLEHTFYWRLVEIIQRDMMGNAVHLHKVQTIIITRLFIGTARQERLRRLGSNASAGILGGVWIISFIPGWPIWCGSCVPKSKQVEISQTKSVAGIEIGSNQGWCMEISFGQRHTCVKKVEVYPRDGCRYRHQDQRREFGPNPQVVEVTIFFIFGLTVVTGHFK